MREVNDFSLEQILEKRIFSRWVESRDYASLLDLYRKEQAAHISGQNELNDLRGQCSRLSIELTAAKNIQRGQILREGVCDCTVTNTSIRCEHCGRLARG